MMKRTVSSALMVMFLIGIQFLNPFSMIVQAMESRNLVGDQFIEDVNNDGKIDISDLSQVASTYNAQSGNSNYKLVNDIDGNKIIDIYDLVKVSKRIGTNAIPYRVFNVSKLVGRYNLLSDAKSFTAQNRNYQVVDSSGKEIWRSRYELYNGTTLKGRYNTLNEAIGASGNLVGTYVRDAADGNKVVWQYVDQTVYGVVTASSLNVRSGPGTSYSKIGSLSNGAKVVIVDSSNSGWHKINYGSGYGYVSKDYIQIQKPTPPPIPGERRVVLDPGHGGSDSGAVGPGGTREKDVVLKVGLKARDMLKAKGYEVLMTRETDVYVSLTERRDFSNASGAQFFVSIHANAYSATSKGTETFGNPNFSQSWSFANTLQRNMVSSFGLTNRGTKDGSGLAVIRANNVPAALVELAFISNPNEEALLKSDAFQTKAAEAIVKSIEESY